MHISDDIFERISRLIPGNLPWDMRTDVIQDVVVLVCEGKISEESLDRGIKKYLPALRKKYPSLMFQLSLDAPVNTSDGTTLTFGDLITKPALQRRRRRPIGRPRVRETNKANCAQCGTIVYRIGKSIQFCSVNCHLEFQRNKRRKVPDLTTLADLYTKKHLSTVKLARIFGLTDPHCIRRHLLKAGVVLRVRGESKSKFCCEPGCEKPVFKIKHTNNGTSYGSRCFYHRKLHRNKIALAYTRKIRNIPPERWRYKNAV